MLLRSNAIRLDPPSVNHVRCEGLTFQVPRSMFNVEGRILKSPASSNRFQHLAFVAPHFRMLFADVVPAFIGQINLMAQLILDRLQHRSGLIIKVNLLGLRHSHFSKLRWLGTFPCGKHFSREFERKQGIRRGAIEMMKLESRRNRESAGFPLRGHRARLCASFEAQSSALNIELGT